jgi:TRAP-type C4-dicarboxylate transport system permease small subunit
VRTPSLTPLGRVWNGLARGLEILTIALFVALTLDVLWGVVSRYILGHQSRWTEEIAVYLLVWVSLLGAALMYRDRGHLGVDYFVSKLHPDAQRVAAVIAELAVILFAGFTLVYGGGLLVVRTLGTGQITPAMGWQVGYLYSVVPLSGIFIVGFAVEHLLQRQPKAPASPEGGLAE